MSELTDKLEDMDVWFNMSQKDADVIREAITVLSDIETGKELNVEVPLDAGEAIELIQSIEKDIDSLMVGYGFTRTLTTKGEEVALRYEQFGVCKALEETE